jgi:hypothetical protein
MKLIETLLATLLLLDFGPARAAVITQSIDIFATDFEWGDSGPSTPPPALPTLEINFTLTFDNAVSVGPTTDGLTINSFNLPYLVGGYYYTGISADTLVLATEPIFSGCNNPFNTFCIFIAAFSTPDPIVYFVQQTTSEHGYFTAQTIRATVNPVNNVPEPGTITLIAVGLLGLVARRSSARVVSDAAAQ